jgi:PhoPQ-activated pathogenicity-related protein.
MPKYLVNAPATSSSRRTRRSSTTAHSSGPKYLRYVPNADHSLRGSDAQDGILAFYQAVLTKTAMPKFTWDMGKDGSIRVKTEDKPRE